MKMPQKGSVVFVEGYGGAVFAGASIGGLEHDVVFLKFEGSGLREGYGRGIITVPLDEFKENRVYPEQVKDGAPLVESTHKRDEILNKRL